MCTGWYQLASPRYFCIFGFSFSDFSDSGHVCVCVYVHVHVHVCEIVLVSFPF